MKHTWPLTTTTDDLIAELQDTKAALERARRNLENARRTVIVALVFQAVAFAFWLWVTFTG